MKSINVYVPDDLHRKVKILIAKEETTMVKYIVGLIVRDLEECEE